MERRTGTLDRKIDRMSLQGMLLYLPAVIVICLIIAYPLLYALFMSFTNYRPTLRETSMVGFSNYIKILSDSSFWGAMLRSLVFTFSSLGLQIVFGLALAQLFNHPDLKFRNLFRGLAIMPWLIPTVSVALIFKWMFNDLYGILNYLMVDIGILDSPKAWMSNGTTAMVILIIANVWRGTPLMFTMFLAGLQGIPRDYYEAATVDGASAWKQYIKITLPLLTPVIMVSGVLRFIWTFNFYDLPWVMTGGGPGEATQTTPVYAYRTAFSAYRLGEGSAISIILFIVLLGFAALYFAARKRQGSIYN